MKLTQKMIMLYTTTKFKLVSIISKRKAAEKAFQLFCTPFLRTKRKVEAKNAEPLRFTVNNYDIKGHRWNHSPTGTLEPTGRCEQPKKALLLHGFGWAAYKFESYVAPLVKKGYEVLAFDAPAHGDSSGKLVNAIEYSTMIKKAIELYGPVDSFIAHSFGGIALSLAMEDIPHDDHIKIVFIAPATETTSAVDGAFAMLKINDVAVRAAFDQVILKLSGKPTGWFSIRRAVKNISAKILWVHDEDDDVTPLNDALKVREDAHSHIQFMITKGLGHRKIYNDNAVKKAIENFL
jgi:pimeloyl-ACP methyl ester carboxylesterase